MTDILAQVEACYRMLLDPSCVEVTQATEMLQKFYEDPSAFEVLMQVLKRTDIEGVRKHAVVGIERYIRKYYRTMPPDQQQQVFSELLSLMVYEASPYVRRFARDLVSRCLTERHIPAIQEIITSSLSGTELQLEAGLFLQTMCMNHVTDVPSFLSLSTKLIQRGLQSSDLNVQVATVLHSLKICALLSGDGADSQHLFDHAVRIFTQLASTDFYAPLEDITKLLCASINEKVPFVNEVQLLNTCLELLANDALSSHAKGIVHAVSDAVIINHAGDLVANQDLLQSILKVYAALAVNYELDLTNNKAFSALALELSKCPDTLEMTLQAMEQLQDPASECAVAALRKMSEKPTEEPRALRFHDIEITRSDFETTSECAWIIDTVISFQMHVLSEKYADLVQQKKCFFVTACATQFLQTFPEEMVRESLENFHFDQIEYLFLPFSNIDTEQGKASHWSLLCVHRHDGALTISHFDSMNHSNSSSAKALARKVADVFGPKNYDYVALRCPTQPNSYDCGVYVMAYCDLFVASQFDHDAACEKMTPAFISEYRASVRCHLLEMDSDQDRMSGETVRVRFVTKYPQYAAAQGDFDISATLNRQGLSAALNQLFEEEEQIPFDFKINGNFLRQSLAQALKQHHISTESLVTVEFFPAFQPPEEIEAESTEGWISCIRFLGEDLLFSMYDGSVHLGARSWKAGAAVKCVAPIGAKGLIAGDLEGNVVLFDTESGSTNTFSLHNGPVQCVETRPELEHLFITGGSDSNIQMWSTANEGTLVSGFFGHSDSIQTLRWMDQETLLSASLDRTIRLWDVNMQQQKSVLSAPCGVLSAAASGNLVVSGHPDRSVKLWDTRVEVRHSVVREFKSHKNWVVCVEWHDAEVFASASYDGSVKLWNVGTTVPLSTVFQHDEKVMALAVNSEMLVAGGSDQVLHKYRFKKL